MINVILNREGFEYDIHSLVKAFYPGEDVKVSVNSDTFSVCKANGDIFINRQKDFLEITISEGDGFKIEITDDMSRQEEKNLLKQNLYRSLSKLLNKKLPWGSLTGIRPTRLAMDYLEAGNSPENTVLHMENMYYASREKAQLCTSIAQRERDIINKYPYRSGYSLYVGIPFCPTTCMYCSFPSYSIKAFEKQVEFYLSCLFRELEQGAKLFSDKILYSLYIGGGTPTSLNPDQLEELLSRLEQYYDLTNLQEFTVEAGRPDSITPKKLEVLKKHKVTRISVNPQTMNQETLDTIGRRHSVEDTVTAFKMAREQGFDNINMDLILGLPGEGLSHVSHTMEVIKELSPDSLTVHSLAVKRASRLAEYVSEHGIGDLNNSEAMMDIAASTAADLGLLPYYLYRQKNMTGNLENVGFAAQDKHGLYNILMMEEIHPILACGAGTISKQIFPDNRIERTENVKDLKNYLERIDEMLLRKERLFSEGIS